MSPHGRPKGSCACRQSRQAVVPSKSALADLEPRHSARLAGPRAARRVHA